MPAVTAGSSAWIFLSYKLRHEQTKKTVIMSGLLLIHLRISRANWPGCLFSLNPGTFPVYRPDAPSCNVCIT